MAAVIGDVVQSRSHADRLELQRRVTAALDASSARVPAIQPFAMTIGDEFQGVFETLDHALVATFVIQISLTGVAMIRFGIGVGALTVMSEEGPFGQDGPAWWDARAAIDSVKAAERSYGSPPHWRTAIGGDDPAYDMHRSYLQLRDHVIAGIDEVDADIVGGLMDGHTQSAIADRLVLDKGAVSRRVSGHGISALLRSLPVHDA